MKIIAYGHRSRVGKDTAAGYTLKILRERGHKVIRLAFADYLKQNAYDLYSWAGVKPKVYYDNNPDERFKILPKLGCSVRDLWVKLGMSIRDIHIDTWINLVIDKYFSNDYIVISDIRFINEVNKIKEIEGSKIIKITRKDAEYYDSPADNALEGFDPWDHILSNDGTYDELYKKILSILG